MQDPVLTSTSRYVEYLVTRIFERNEYGTILALLRAIHDAHQHETIEQRALAVAELRDKAPLRRNSGFDVSHYELMDFLIHEAAGFGAYLRAIK